MPVDCTGWVLGTLGLAGYARLMLLTALLLVALAPGQDAQKPEATSLLGKPLFAVTQSADARARMERDLAAARSEFEKNPRSPDAAIWLGRRTAYLGRYRDAIAVFTAAIDRHPSDARLYRHRGHRYISVREFDRAIADLSKAASLVTGRPDTDAPRPGEDLTGHQERGEPGDDGGERSLA